MDLSRSVAKAISNSLFEFYSDGALVGHRIHDVRGAVPHEYRSWGDTEVTLAPVNNFQDDEYLQGFADQFANKQYKHNKQDVSISGAYITFPHTERGRNVIHPAPSTDMEWDVLDKYVWPNADLNRNSKSYYGLFLLDVGQNDLDIEEEEDDAGIRSFNPTRSSKWLHAYNYPIMVGSNKCNMNAIRSYVNNHNLICGHATEEEHDLNDWRCNTTHDQRAEEILTKYHCEIDIPDGYFIVDGKMKRVCVIDRLQMNMIYSVETGMKSKKKKNLEGEEKKPKVAKPVNDAVVEVRSLHPNHGVSFHSMFLVVNVDMKKVRGGNINRDIYKFYSSIIVLSADRLFTTESGTTFNVFDAIRGYALIVTESGPKDGREAMNDLESMVRLLCGGDTDIMRGMAVTRAATTSTSDEDVLHTLNGNLVPKRGSVDDGVDIRISAVNGMMARFLPHVIIVNPYTGEIDYPGTYHAKVTFLAMMVIELMLVASKRKPFTDRKMFTFKRWETAGYALREYTRELLTSNTNLNRLTKEHSLLLTTMNSNKWPSGYSYHESKYNKNYMTFSRNPNEDKDGVVDDVLKYNLVSIIDSIRAVKILANNGMNSSATRIVHTSQWGFQCPANTPENANIGLINNLAETCLVSDELNIEERMAFNRFIHDVYEKYRIGNGADDAHILSVDGSTIGTVSFDAYGEIREARQKGLINRGIGVSHHRKWAGEIPCKNDGVAIINVNTSHGRPLFTLLRIDQDVDKYEEILELSMEGNVYDFLDRGLIEIIDASESVHNAIIAEWVDTVRVDIEATGTTKYTHAMIMPGDILSQTTSCLPFLECNPPARGTYATQHAKQAIGAPFIYENDRFDHNMNFLREPRRPRCTTHTSRRLGITGINPVTKKPLKAKVGFGRDLRIAIYPNFGNVDDGIHFTQELADSGILEGSHYNIFNATSNPFSRNDIRYNIQLSDETGQEIIDPRTGVGLNDPDFSDGVIVPYGGPLETIELTDEELGVCRQLRLSDMYDDASGRLSGIVAYQVPGITGRIYVRYGFYRTYRVEYADGLVRDDIIPGRDPINLPGKAILLQNIGVMRDGQMVTVASRMAPNPLLHIMALYAMRNDVRRTLDTSFIDPVPVFSVPSTTGQIHEWFIGSRERISRVFGTIGGQYMDTNIGRMVAVRGKREIERNEAAIKTLEVDSTGRIIGTHKERFDITYGTIESTHYGDNIKIKGRMPIGPKQGNKYAAMYAQKGVCSEIIPSVTEEMVEKIGAGEMKLPERRAPMAQWFNPNRINPETGEKGMTESMTFDIIFNPLAWPSRMTIGMPYEVLINGTISYIFDLSDADGNSYGLEDMYHKDRDAFDDFMHEKFGVDNAADVIDDLADCTAFIYDVEEKKKECMEFRRKLGIPADGLYDLFLQDENGEYTQKIKTPIFCGYVQYVTLPHLVDNKKRARGYVGKRDPVTQQPVRGRRRNGGANTGTMEVDGYKSHGAAGLAHERLNFVSDHKRMLKCSVCTGLVTTEEQMLPGIQVLKTSYTCMDCGTNLDAGEVYRNDGVHSWTLFRHFFRGIGAEIREYYE